MNQDEHRPQPIGELTLVGLLGYMFGCDPEDARAVDAAVESALTDPELYRVHRAMAIGMGGDPAAARATLEPYIEAHPEDDLAKVVLGTSLVMAGEPQGRAWMDGVLATSSDADVREAALSVIQLLESSGGRR
jgi:hypothetical protein